MAEYKIEKGIPLPPSRGKYPGLSKKLGELEVDESVFVPNGSPRDVGGLYAGRLNKKFTQRKCVEDGVEGLRIWRLE